LDKLPMNRVKDYEAQMLDFLERKHPEIMKEIVSSGKLDDGLKTKLNAALKEFDGIFTA
jgi:F-type H+-transporting ATPase subunit alpha